MSLIKLKCGGKGPFLAISILSGAISVFGQVSGLIYSLERNPFVGGESSETTLAEDNIAN